MFFCTGQSEDFNAFTEVYQRASNRRESAEMVQDIADSYWSNAWYHPSDSSTEEHVDPTHTYCAARHTGSVHECTEWLTEDKDLLCPLPLCHVHIMVPWWALTDPCYCRTLHGSSVLKWNYDNTHKNPSCCQSMYFPKHQEHTEINLH